MSAITFDHVEQHFAPADADPAAADMHDVPLTVTLQVTRRCNIKCVYCSESDRIREPTFSELAAIVERLAGVPRIIVAGGEPTLRKDLVDLLKLCRTKCQVLVMATNAIRVNEELARSLRELLDYVDVTIDGPPRVHNDLRGSFREVVQGLFTLRNAGVPLSMVVVLMPANRDVVHYSAQIADLFGAVKLKILSPIPKGRGLQIASDTLSREEVHAVFEHLKREKARAGWSSRITVTEWTRIDEGHALLVHPDGEVVASPVWTKAGCVESVGNLRVEDIREVWRRYPYKDRHVAKYTEKTLLVC